MKKSGVQISCMGLLANDLCLKISIFSIGFFFRRVLTHGIENPS